MGRPKGSKNKSNSQAALSEEDIANLNEYHSEEKWVKNSVFCATCQTEVPPGAVCRCPKAPVQLQNTKPYLTVSASNMSKVRFYNSITKEWFKPMMSM